MSTPILDAPTETTGWLLEMTGTGDNIVYRAVDNAGARIAITHRLSDGSWLLVSLTDFCGEDALRPVVFDTAEEAVAWLTYLANLYTRPVTR